ncbi:MAG: EVE domain-containing protein [Solirubrobacterales bacterium]|nr:EVE domain-containing protein [Solirubrobacterales bacterium]
MEEATTWVLTSSPDNHTATRETGFSVIGLKERNRKRAERIEPGDRIVLYLTKEMTFGGSIIVTGDMFEDRAKIWPGKPGNPDPYPWRFPTEPEVVLSPDQHVPAERLKDTMAHIQKWPADHWKLAFQGQIREVTNADAKLLLKSLRAAQSA